MCDLQHSSKLSDEQLDLDVTKNLYTRDSKYTSFAIFLKGTAWFQELLKILERLLLCEAARSTAHSEFTDIDKGSLHFIAATVECPMKFLIPSCPVVKMRFWRLPPLETTGKSVLNHNLYIFILIRPMEDWSIHRTQISLHFHNFRPQPSSLDSPASAVTNHASSSSSWSIWFAHNFTLKLDQEAHQISAEKACP